MRPISFALLALVLVPACRPLYSQDVTKPIIPTPPPPAAAPAPQVPAQPPAAMSPQATGTAAPGTIGTTPPVQPAAGVSKDYIIGPKDGLSVSVWKEPTVSATVEVRTDGMITLPILGDVKATDFTPEQLAADLTKRLEKYITLPLVTVTVLSSNSKFIYFTGEGIGHGTTMPFDPNVTIVQAIIRAGGLTPFAKQNKIFIWRTVNGKQTKIPFDYKKAMKFGDLQGVTLQPGDIINVP
jgi:polysaccharide export outer membrane protein